MDLVSRAFRRCQAVVRQTYNVPCPQMHRFGKLKSNSLTIIQILDKEKEALSREGSHGNKVSLNWPAFTPCVVSPLVNSFICLVLCNRSMFFFELVAESVMFSCIIPRQCFLNYKTLNISRRTKALLSC